MAFSFDDNTGDAGAGRRRRFRSSSTISEMNIVPLVDVVLVLLIIFMLTAQAMEFGLEVEVPKVRYERTSAQDLPIVTVTKSGEVYLGEKAVNINSLGPDIKAKYGKRSGAAYVRADKGVVWDVVAQVIDELNTAKIAVRVVTTTRVETRGRQ